ncbi:unnamed protein product [Cyprideis torosa]|uniref:Uncharacterized protein n=1 Tax=Cyprideis torosa TaxID=163714 RepID=A0A7R8WBS6_9CRUS|nr:unnamed protein product [Cyprideis torosa]CAG0892621.1 unnamed protein product [Cyprideis torosa]
MSEGDWNNVTILRKRAPKPSQLRSQQAVNAAQRQGIEVATEKKFNAATNKHTKAVANASKLDEETEELRHKTIPLEVGKLIQQGRQAKELTQKELATKINEKPQLVNDYEAGRGIPNPQILAKMERVLGIKLRGKDKGAALAPPAPKKK